ncbi:ssrA-binding protein [Candidatus Endolissoclinum faulkneri L5]|uniref:SsrA-binding protein n=1 Tax=Candidatus Endolissoclinum faulkneri L5 TaxID=1401328 RepID=V9TRL1_9PROT|nr:SsrA-binding protein SmpB [Candidatus Endolissoclinum faulkneri]AHC73549.1 ssrA-binding protein [Candidatus Endolissoclinum faulkneri L5]
MAERRSAYEKIVSNRRAKYKYVIEDTIEAGIILTGSEIKSLCQGNSSINESYAGDDNGELALINSHIPQYKPGGVCNHDPRRVRRLLVHRKERERLFGMVRQKGYTLVPISIYFNDRGIAKLQIGLARGKKIIDKRQEIKKRDWERRQARLLRKNR